MTPPSLPPAFALSPEVARALRDGAPVVALESTVITHGLPHPENLALAHAMEENIRQTGCQPATIAVWQGRIRVGLSQAELAELAALPHAHQASAHKVSARDFARLLVTQASGGTTVAGTLFVAHKVGIRVFATGGIGGVHRENPQDVSADLWHLAQTPMIVVCAGAKAILDLPATLEYLETAGVPVVGYQTDEFPAFYAGESGLPVSWRADSPAEVVELAATHWELGLRSAVLVAVPPPSDAALPAAEVERAIQQALAEARAQNLRGPQVTPFLLDRVSEWTGQASLQANLALLKNNARVAGLLAQELARLTRRVY